MLDCSSFSVSRNPPFSFAKKDLLHSATILHAALATPNRLDLIHDLQRHLLRCIVRTERRIQRLRRKIKRPNVAFQKKVPREIANARKDTLKSLKKRVEELTQLLFLFRCFGDGIAFIYQSRHSLKHTYYDGHYNVKETAGFMTEHGRLKRGFSREYRVLCSGIKRGIPVVMSDLTNIVRYGDVCALGANDPLPIEVKTSHNRNLRTSRQDQLRRSLIDFYSNDGAEVFRGIPNVKRIEICNEESDFREIVNSCISTAMKTGWSSMNPEPGLTYIAWSGNNTSKLSSLEFTKSTCIYSISPQPSHLPSYPFTLSLRPHNCFAFMQQEVHLLVAIELMSVKKAFKQLGVHATMLMNGTHSMQITMTPNDLIQGTWRVSELMFARVATEFLSIDRFAKDISKVFDQRPKSILSIDDAKNLAWIVNEVPEEWNDAVDCWITK